MANEFVCIKHRMRVKKQNISLQPSLISIEIIRTFLFHKSLFSIVPMLNVNPQDFSPHTFSFILLAREFEQALMNAGIKYRIYGGMKFYQRSEIKSALAYLRLVENENDNDAFRRVINYPPRAIGKATLDKIEKGAKENQCSLFTFIQNDSNLSQQKKIMDFIQLIRECRDKQSDIELHEQALYIFERSGLMASYQKKQEIERLQNLSELCNAMKQFTQLYHTNNLVDYLSVVALVRTNPTLKQSKVFFHRIQRILKMGNWIHRMKMNEYK